MVAGRVIKIAAVVASVAALCAGQDDGASKAHSSTQEVEPSTQEVQPLRQVEVTLLGNIADVRGLGEWPVSDTTRSWWIEEPVDLALHLPAGRTIKLRTRPLLILSREGDVVATVRFVPEDLKPASIQEQGRTIEKCAPQFGAAEDGKWLEACRQLQSIPRRPETDAVMGGGIQRISCGDIDEKSQLEVELTGGGSKWSVVFVVTAGDKEWERFIEARARAGPASTRTSGE